MKLDEDLEIIRSLLLGLHLSKPELDRAKKLIHLMDLEVKGRR